MTEKPEGTGMDSKSPAERDRVDLAHEMAGEETGRIKRFLHESSIGYAADTEEKKSRREYRSLLQMLLAEDPQYAALYARVSEKIINASRAVDQALIGLNQRLEASVVMLQEMREAAGELPDGTKVFRSESDGSIYTENGTRLDDAEAQSIHIPDNAPSWEAHRAEKERHELLLRQREEVETYQRDVLKPVQDQLENEDNPLSVGELEDLEQRLETQMPDVVRSELHAKELSAHPIERSSTSVAHNIVDKMILDVPDMSGAFDLARVEVPDIASPSDINPGPQRAPS